VTPGTRLALIVPAFFVVLWATGFVVAREGVAYADPLTLVTLRFAIAATLLSAISLATGARWPSRREALHCGVVGLLLQTTYVAGVFLAIDHHLAAGVTALVTGVQPLLTACIVGPLLKERVTPLQWGGLLLGLGGVALVVERKVHFDSGTDVGLGLAFAALVGITAGTLYQRRFLPTVDLRSGMVVQYGVGAVSTVVLAAALEPMHIAWTWQLGASLAWMSVVLSVGAYLGFLFLVRRVAVARVTSLFYLVPPVAALMAWPWFGESVTLGMALGMALAAAGVAIVQRGAAAPQPGPQAPRRGPGSRGSRSSSPAP
jgi:drug/metabolite transporter (DMT)-like permease